jgi:hypothetical protein
MADTYVATERSRGHHLAALAWSWRDAQQFRIAMQQRDPDRFGGFIVAMEKIEKELGVMTTAELRRQAIWRWLENYPGLGGVQTARLVALIDDPHLFPGQKCSKGHYEPPIHRIGAPCPKAVKGEVCPGKMLAPRPHTGVSSLRHYVGLHVVDGNMPRKTRGQQGDWNPIGRTVLLMPKGIVDQIIQHKGRHAVDGKVRCPRGETCGTWRLGQFYDAQKARLTAERGADGTRVSDHTDGPASAETARAFDAFNGGGGAEVGDATEAVAGPVLRPYQIEYRARAIVAKRFLGDLLIAWKRLAGPAVAIDMVGGEALP